MEILQGLGKALKQEVGEERVKAGVGSPMLLDECLSLWEWDPGTTCDGRALSDMHSIRNGSDWRGGNAQVFGNKTEVDKVGINAAEQTGRFDGHLIHGYAYVKKRTVNNLGILSN